MCWVASPGSLSGEGRACSRGSSGLKPSSEKQHRVDTFGEPALGPESYSPLHEAHHPQEDPIPLGAPLGPASLQAAVYQRVGQKVRGPDRSWAQGPHLQMSGSALHSAGGGQASCWGVRTERAGSYPER